MMDLMDEALAPGCYGMGMLFKEGSAECSTCPFAAACKPLGERQLAMLRAELGIKPQAAQRPAGADSASPPLVTPATMTLTDGLPKKVAAWIDYIERAGISVTESLARGENPFAGKRPHFLNIACLLLLKMPGGISRDTLSYAFTTKLNWGAETAASHITQTRQILEALGAAESVDGMLRLRKF